MFGSASVRPQRGHARLLNALPGTAIVLAGAAFSLLLFLRVQISNGFVRVTGDIYDGRIEVSLLQHWFNVLRGLEHWSRTAYFYPLNDTLGFNDGYLLFGLIFSVFRWFGVEPMLASDLVNAVVRLIGYAGFVAMAVELCGLPLVWATLGAVLFSISNGMSIQEGHQQLLSVCFAPLLVWLLGRAWQALPMRPSHAAGFGTLSALLYGSWLLTGFYMAWFTTFFACLWGFVLLATAGVPGHGNRRRMLHRLWRWPSAVTFLMLCASLLPFLRVYLPAAQLTGQHSFTEAFRGLPEPGDWLRVGPENLLFGWLEPILDFGLTQKPGGESLVGFSPVLLLASSFGAVLCWRGLGRRPGSGRPVIDLWSDGLLGQRSAWSAVATAVLLSFLLCAQVNGLTIWGLVYRFIPGAAGIRQETRFLLMLDLPIVLLGMLAMHWLSLRWRSHRSASRNWANSALFALSALLILGEINMQNAQGMNRAEERVVTEQIPSAPIGCKAFVVISRGNQPLAGSPDADGLYHHTVDAMMLAEERALPTVNGYATFVPSEIATINPLPLRFGALRDYTRQHELQSTLCGLDLDHQRWVTSLPGPLPLPTDGIRFAGDNSNDAPFLGLGWSHHEADGRWTVGPRAEMDMVLPPQDRARTLKLDVTALPFFPPHRTASPITVIVNGSKVARWVPLSGQQHFTAEVPGNLPGLPLMRIEFLIDTPMTPRSTDGSADDRPLGMYFRALTLTPEK